MPILMFLAAILLILTGASGRQNELGALLRDDLFGRGGFLWVAGGIVVITVFGLLTGLRDTSRMLIVLLLAGWVLAHPESVGRTAQALGVEPGPRVEEVRVGRAALVGADTNPQPMAERQGTMQSTPPSMQPPGLIFGGQGIGSIGGMLGGLFGGAGK